MLDVLLEFLWSYLCRDRSEKKRSGLFISYRSLHVTTSGAAMSRRTRRWILRVLLCLGIVYLKIGWAALFLFLFSSSSFFLSLFLCLLLFFFFFFTLKVIVPRPRLFNRSHDLWQLNLWPLVIFKVLIIPAQEAGCWHLNVINRALRR